MVEPGHRIESKDVTDGEEPLGLSEGAAGRPEEPAEDLDGAFQAWRDMLDFKSAAPADMSPLLSLPRSTPFRPTDLFLAYFLPHISKLDHCKELALNFSLESSGLSSRELRVICFLRDKFGLALTLSQGMSRPLSMSVELRRSSHRASRQRLSKNLAWTPSISISASPSSSAMLWTSLATCQTGASNEGYARPSDPRQQGYYEDSLEGHP